MTTVVQKSHRRNSSRRPQRQAAQRKSAITSDSDSCDEEFYRTQTPVLRNRKIRKPKMEFVINPEKPMQATIRLRRKNESTSSTSEEIEEILSIMPVRNKVVKIKPVSVKSTNEEVVNRTPRKTKWKFTGDEIIDLTSPTSPEKQRKLSGEIEKIRPQLTTPQIRQINNSSPKKAILTTPEKQNRTNNKYLSNKTPEKQSPEKFKSPNKNNEENVPQTPSTMLKDLTINSPKSRRSLFKENSAYQSARKALHSSFPTNLTGREKELEILRDFISERLEKKSSGTLYVSGPPGTGKTASLNMILEQDEISSELHKVYVNCTTMKSSGSIYSRIVKELKIKTNCKTEKENCAAIENYLGKNHKMILLVLDEIDQLESKKQSILYTIFEWPSQLNSKLILIGIANALDLTDRILPRLQARCELKPTLLHFAPYSKKQIVDIITHRLRGAGVGDVFQASALQMLAGKVAAISGDVRRALDIARRVIEIVEQNIKNNVLTSVENLTNQLIDEDKIIKPVDLIEVVNVLNNVYNTTQFLNETVDESFPIQQKIIVCSLLLTLKKGKNKNVTIGKLHEVYKKICGKRNIQSVDQGEFVGLCSLIESKGIIKVGKRKETRLHSVSLEWDEEEVAAALKDKLLLSSILDDDSCLGRN